MVKRLLIILFLIAVTCNSLTAFPPHRDGEGGCGAECCAAARQAAGQNGPIATISGICCITECQQSAETTTPAAAFNNLNTQPLSALAGFFLSTPDQNSYLKHARFPISPTRYLDGSSNRYLDTGSLLI